MKHFGLHIGLNLNPWKWDFKHHYLIGEGRTTIWEWQFIFLQFSATYFPPTKGPTE